MQVSVVGTPEAARRTRRETILGGAGHVRGKRGRVLQVGRSKSGGDVSAVQIDFRGPSGRQSATATCHAFGEGLFFHVLSAEEISVRGRFGQADDRSSDCEQRGSSGAEPGLQIN